MSSPDLQTMRHAKLTATQALLGDTIQLDADAWRDPSALPGWTRAHVATHLARNADAISRVVEGLQRGEQVFMYDSNQAREADIETGAGRDGLEIQEDLDRSAGRLNTALDELDDEQWAAPLQMRPNLTHDRAEYVVVQRLTEVAVHHIDLRIGMTFDDLDPEPARWMLERTFTRLSGVNPDLAVRLVDAEGTEVAAAGGADAPVVSGSVQRLLGWLLGRLDDDAVTGGDRVTVPNY
ncbi:MAG: maleylpyruvate isomerase family mycothiol-dependent enzyme [Propionibacterium sp.]|nr:maleylpyruvate isomerase family mycothiol-dependent enzyme [Propionibacterium sp.]